MLSKEIGDEVTLLIMIKDLFSHTNTILDIIHILYCNLPRSQENVVSFIFFWLMRLSISRIFFIHLDSSGWFAY